MKQKEFDAIFQSHEFSRADLIDATEKLQLIPLRNETQVFAISNIQFLSDKFID